MSIQSNNDPQVSMVMLPLDEFPIVEKKCILKETLEEMSQFQIGIACVADKENKFLGLITDGDIRRMLSERDSFADLTAKDIMTKNPKLIQSTAMVIDALNILEDFSITQLVVVENEDYKGILHLHDILKEGIL